jgi:hypothetical protein
MDPSTNSILTTVFPAHILTLALMLTTYVLSNTIEFRGFHLRSVVALTGDSPES